MLRRTAASASVNQTGETFEIVGRGGVDIALSVSRFGLATSKPVPKVLHLPSVTRQRRPKSTILCSD